MTHCSNCNATLKENTKFCTSCGSPIKEVEQIRKVDTGLTELVEDTPKSSSKEIKIIIGLFAVIALFFIGKNFISSGGTSGPLSEDTSGPLFDINEEVGKIEGEWYDPSGSILKDKSAIINVRIIGAFAEGKDENNTIEISMIPINKNSYYTITNIDGIEGEFIATYYSEEEKIVFNSQITKTSWYIKKLNK